MHIKEIFKKNKTTLSFEFSPPKNKKSNDSLFETIKTLESLVPSFVSITYGAGGSTRQFTNNLLTKLKNETNFNLVSHLTCVGHSRNEIATILKEFEKAQINNIMALRGDPPAGHSSFSAHPEGYSNAAQLVEYIKKTYPNMGIGVAGFPEGHPETPNRLDELDYLKAKVDAGADYICTQLFFDNHDFYDFCERCEIVGIKVPIIAGIMPITSINGMKKMASLALGAKFPAKLLRSLNRASGDEYVKKVGIHWASEQVRDLLDNNVKGIHFYTLNKSNATRTIYDNLGLKNSLSLKNPKKQSIF